MGDQLGELWSEVAQPHAALRAKMLSALTRPFDEATNNAGPGEGEVGWVKGGVRGWRSPICTEGQICS